MSEGARIMMESGGAGGDEPGSRASELVL